MKNRKNRKNVAAAPVVETAAPPAPADAPPVVVNASPADAPADAPPAAPSAPPRFRRTIGTVAAGDTRDTAPVRTLSLAARFALLHVDAAPFTFAGGFLNVTQPVVACDAPTLDPNVPGYVSLPHTVNRAALIAARDVLTSAATVLADNHAAPTPLTRAAIVAFCHDRAMRSVTTRETGYFDTTGVSTLDVAASLTRAACRLARLPVSGCGTRAALAATLPARLSEIDARLAALDAP